MIGGIPDPYLHPADDEYRDIWELRERDKDQCGGIVMYPASWNQPPYISKRYSCPLPIRNW